MTIRIRFDERQEMNGQELLHMKENKTRVLVLMNIEYFRMFDVLNRG